MRKDLNKQLCERERRGGYRDYHHYRRARAFQPDWDLEDGGGPRQESMRFRYGYNGKDFNENLNPLRGQIRKFLGRKWNDFYSELCQVFDKRSVINQHILGHLQDFIHKDVYRGKDGRLYYLQRYAAAPEPLEGSHVEYYVDPDDGLIKLNPFFLSWRQKRKERKAAHQAEINSKFRELPDGSVLHQIGGNWFHFTFSIAPVGWYTYSKPPEKNTFTRGWWDKTKTWDKLNAFEREMWGVSHFHGHKVRDLYTFEYVFTEKGQPGKKYHATKKSASRKLLKQAGVIQ